MVTLPLLSTHMQYQWSQQLLPVSPATTPGVGGWGVLWGTGKSAHAPWGQSHDLHLCCHLCFGRNACGSTCKGESDETRPEQPCLERGHRFCLWEQPHDGATMGGQHGRQSGGEEAFWASPASPLSVGPAVTLAGQCGGRVNVLLGHLCVLQDVHVDEESLLVLSHAAQQQCALF